MFEEKKPTMELRFVAHRVWMGPAPFDFKIEKRLEQKFEIVRGGEGNGVSYEDVWVPVPCVSEEKANG